jgi:putative NADH-flavin reductase
MNIAVMGASGRTGKEFVDQALQAGHTVRGGVRNIQNLPRRTGLTPVTCDTTKLADVRQLIAEVDAVICLHSKRRRGDDRNRPDALHQFDRYRRAISGRQGYRN